MTKLCGVPVRTRLPIGAWFLAGLVAVFAVLSSLLSMRPASDHLTAAKEQTYKSAQGAYRARMAP
jgi:hypothetical protein